jgi:hypothetical protein
MNNREDIWEQFLPPPPNRQQFTLANHQQATGFSNPLAADQQFEADSSNNNNVVERNRLLQQQRITVNRLDDGQEGQQTELEFDHV